MLGCHAREDSWSNCFLSRIYYYREGEWRPFKIHFRHKAFPDWSFRGLGDGWLCSVTEIYLLSILVIKIEDSLHIDCAGLVTDSSLNVSPTLCSCCVESI